MLNNIFECFSSINHIIKCVRLQIIFFANTPVTCSVEVVMIQMCRETHQVIGFWARFKVVVKKTHVKEECSEDSPDSLC